MKTYRNIYYFILCCLLFISSCSTGDGITEQQARAKMVKLGDLGNNASLFVDKNNISLGNGTAMQKIKLNLIGNSNDSYTISFGNSMMQSSKVQQANDANGITVIPSTCVLSAKQTSCEVTIKLANTTKAGTYSINVASTNQSTKHTVNLLPLVIIVSASELPNTKEMLTFSINNPNKMGEVFPGVIAGTNITVTLPYNTPVRSLVANFTTNGKTVTVANNAQSSGSSIVDFTSPVIYTVTAQDGISQLSYTVTVKLAASTATDLTNFTVAGQIGSTVVSGNNITVTVSVADKTITPVSLATSFATTAHAVTVAGNIVNSGDLVNFDPNTPTVFVVTAFDGKTQQSYNISIVLKSSLDSMTSFSLPGQVSSKINLDNTINIVMPYGTTTDSLKSLIATFATSANATATVTDPSGTMPAVSGKTSNDYSSSATTPVVFTVTAEDGKTYQQYNVTISNAKSSAANITKFAIQNTTADKTPIAVTISGTNISLNIVSNISAKALIAQFTLSPGATVSVGSTVQTSGTTANDFSQGAITYTVTAEDGVTQQNYIATITKSAFAYIANYAPDATNMTNITSCQFSNNGSYTFTGCKNYPIDSSATTQPTLFHIAINSNNQMYVTSPTTNVIYNCTINIDGSVQTPCNKNTDQANIINPYGASINNNILYYTNNTSSPTIGTCNMNNDGKLSGCSTAFPQYSAIMLNKNLYNILVNGINVLINNNKLYYYAETYQEAQADQPPSNPYDMVYNINTFKLYMIDSSNANIYVYNFSGSGSFVGTRYSTNNLSNINGGIAMSSDSTYLFVSEITQNKIKSCQYYPMNSNYSCLLLSTGNVSLNQPYGIAVVDSIVQ